MQTKIKVLCLSIWYPMSISRYFERALLRNEEVELITVGPFTGSWIPWMGGMNLPVKYAKSPDIALEFNPNVGRVDYDLVRANLPEGWKPDIVLAIDAGINWVRAPWEGYVATVATDPHVLDYDHARNLGKLFNMQLAYSERNDEYLPYAYDPTVHYPLPYIEKDTDVVLVGMPYENRVALRDELRKYGISMVLENGPVFDEYRELANRAHVGASWSSMNDLIARFFETPAMGLPMVANRVSDAKIYLTEGVDYLAFSQLGDAVGAIKYMREHPAEADQFAKNAMEKIKPHTYDKRVNQILRSCGF